MPDPRAGRDGIRHRDTCSQPPSDSYVQGDAVVRRCPECSRAAAVDRPLTPPRPLDEEEQ